MKNFDNTITLNLRLVKVSRDDLKKLPFGTEVFVYHNVMDYLRSELIGKSFIGFSKHCSDYLDFYVREEVLKLL